MLRSLTRWFRRRARWATPLITALDNSQVTPQQREDLRAWLKLPATQLAIALLESTRPALKVAETPEGDINNQRAIRRLAEIDGWYRYRNFLLLLGHTPKQIEDIVETYPDQE